MRDWVKWLLFINSYTPFFLILLLQDYERAAWPVFNMPVFSWTVIGLLVVSNLAVALFLRGALLASEPLPAFQTATSKAGDSLNYIVTYIIPFLEFDTQKDLLPLLILLVVIGVIYVHSNLLAVNPMLSLLGYRVYELAADSTEPVLLLTKKRRNGIQPDMPVVQVTDEIFVEVNR